MYGKLLTNIILPENLFIWQPCKQGYKNYYFFFFLMEYKYYYLCQENFWIMWYLLRMLVQFDLKPTWYYFFFFFNGIQALLSLSREHLNHVIFITDTSAIWFKTHVIMLIPRKVRNTVSESFGLIIEQNISVFSLIIEQNISVWSHQKKKSVWVYVPNHFEITVAYKWYIYIYI